VKHDAATIVANLNITDPSTKLPLIPRGSIVYLSTDDPDGVCLNCLVNRIPCDNYPKGKNYYSPTTV
jgi:hypothetical protein